MSDWFQHLSAGAPTEKTAESRKQRRRTKKEMRKALNRFAREQGIDPKKAMLVAGGAMYMHGMRDEVNDIDFFHPDLPNFVKKQQGRFEMDGGPARDLPEAAKQWKRMGGMRVQTPEAMLEFYKNLNRPKDQPKIQFLSNHLTKKANARVLDILGRPAASTAQAAVTPGALASMSRELGNIGRRPARFSGSVGYTGRADQALAERIRQRMSGFFRKHGLPENTRYAVGSGTAQSLMGMRPGQPLRDIDVLVDRLPGGASHLDTGGIDAWTHWRDPRLVRQAFDNPVNIYGVPVMRPEHNLEFKKIIQRGLGTEKGTRDAQDIAFLNQYLRQSRGHRKFGSARYSLRKAMKKELLEIKDALKEVATKPMAKEHWKSYSRHSALNAGQAARALRYFTDYPRTPSKLQSAKKRTAQLVNALAFTAMPPTHHTAESLKGMAEGVGRHRDWLKHGYKPWKHPEPVKKACFDELEKIAEDLPPLNRWLHRVRRQAKRKGYDVFVVAEDPSHPLGGGSVTHATGGKDSAVRSARKAHMQWEQRHGHDPHHDWKAKTAEAQGHWRRLKPGQTGHDQAGQETPGRTWVAANRMREGMTPMKHQADFSKAVLKNLKKDGGIIAAHGTGTGKTFSSINAFEELKGKGRAKRALVITPAGLRENYAKKGVDKFTTSKAVILKKPQAVDDDVEYVVVSYAAFRQNPDAWIQQVQPDTIIADEVHRAANPGSSTHQALRQARAQVPKFIGLTASVVQNKPDELVPLLELAEGGKQELKTKKQFRKAHIKRQRAEARGIFGGLQYEENLTRKAELRASVGASVHYIEDLDAESKPTKNVELVEVKMSPAQKRQYQLAMSGIDPVLRKKIAEGQEVSRKEAANAFLKLMRARQASNSLHLVTPHMSLEEAAEKTPKIKKVLDDAIGHIEGTPDAQVIMYTNMVAGGVDVLEAGLKKRGIKYGIFAGRGVPGVTEETRQEAVDKYLAGENKVIVITGAGAEGLSLGNTTMVQVVDGHYNPERISQAEARGIRAGGLSHRPPEERQVQVKRYVSTIPKSIWQTVTFRKPEKSVGQWVYSTAAKKGRLNRQLRDVLADRSEHERKKRESFLYRTFRGRP